MIALLGKCYEPNDGLVDQCNCLAPPLARHQVSLTIVKVRWSEEGWIRALRKLWRESADWRGEWVLLQYTALAWSRRGFPWGALAVAAILRRRGARCAVVFHEYTGYGGSSWRERVRHACQVWIVRRLYRKSAMGIFTIPLDSVGWLPPDRVEHEAAKRRRRAVFIPIGAGIPEFVRTEQPSSASPLEREKRVVVFGVRYAPGAAVDVDGIAAVAREARKAIPNLRFVVLGRGSSEAQELMERALEGSSVALDVLGTIPADEVAREFGRADALLFVRFAVSLQRSTAMAGIACGLPIVGYASSVPLGPLTEAGIEWASSADPKDLARALVNVLNDPQRWTELHQRNVRAQQEYFSWNRIAKLYIEALPE
jgi:glycosyltransferase involved in cell wall biosynthesis